MKNLPSKLLEDLAKAGFASFPKERAPVIMGLTSRADALPSVYRSLVVKQGVLDAHDLVTLEVDSSQHIRVIVYDVNDEDSVDGIVYCDDFAPLNSAKGMALLDDALILQKTRYCG